MGPGAAWERNESCREAVVATLCPRRSAWTVALREDAVWDPWTLTGYQRPDYLHY